MNKLLTLFSDLKDTALFLAPIASTSHRLRRSIQYIDQISEYNNNEGMPHSELGLTVEVGKKIRKGVFEVISTMAAYFG